MDEYIEALRKKECTCSSCPSCNGTGNVWFSFTGEYLGRSRCDDLDTMETCEDCNGTGVFDTCDRCRDLEEALNEQDCLP